MNAEKKTKARNYAFKFLYNLKKSSTLPLEETLENLNELLEEFDVTYVEPDAEHPDNDIDLEIKKFATDIIKSFLENETAVEEQLAPYIKKGGLESVSFINRLSLDLGAHELLYVKATPPKVAINEAINIAKKYGTKDSHAFVNGVLDNFSKTIK